MKNFILFVFLLFPVLCFAEPVQQVEELESIAVVAGLALLAVLELVFRLYPTSRDISIISLFYKLLNVIIPNIQKDKPLMVKAKRGIFEKILKR